MSVTIAKASFSKLKIIKNFLRNTMTRSCNLAMISTEKELVNSFFLTVLQIEDLIRIFSKIKARKCNSSCIKRQIYYKRKYDIYYICIFVLFKSIEIPFF